MPDAIERPSSPISGGPSRLVRSWQRRVAKTVLAPIVFALIATCLAGAQATSIDVERSKVTVEVHKSGLFSGFAHDHQIAAPLSSGKLDPTARVVELHFDARRMKVLDADASESDRAQVQSTMLSDKVLDVARFPEINFVSGKITKPATGSYSVEGELTLHGVSRTVTVPVTLRGDSYVGSVKLKQTDFGIKPVKVMGGTVKVKDEIQIGFEIVPAGRKAAHK